MTVSELLHALGFEPHNNNTKVYDFNGVIYCVSTGYSNKKKSVYLSPLCRIDDGSYIAVSRVPASKYYFVSALEQPVTVPIEKIMDKLKRVQVMVQLGVV